MPRTSTVFGLTGGIACGKSTVAKQWAARGVPVVDADQIAREIVKKGTPAHVDIETVFGPRVLRRDGELDRSKLAEIVFRDPSLRLTLEALTHPRIATASEDIFHRIGSTGAPLIGYEAALIVEGGRAEEFRPLVVVTAPRWAQIARGRTRDAASRDRIEARIDAQMPLERKASLADFVIDNSGGLPELCASADRVLLEVCRRCHVDPAQYRWDGGAAGSDDSSPQL